MDVYETIVLSKSKAALLVKEAGLKGWYLIGVSLPLFLVGALACLIWYNIISQYKALKR